MELPEGKFTELLRRDKGLAALPASRDALAAKDAVMAAWISKRVGWDVEIWTSDIKIGAPDRALRRQKLTRGNCNWACLEGWTITTKEVAIRYCRAG
jgi:hypothetical protein